MIKNTNAIRLNRIKKVEQDISKSLSIMPMIKVIPIKCNAAKTHLSRFPCKFSFLKFVMINKGTKTKQKVPAAESIMTLEPGISNVFRINPIKSNEDEISPTVKIPLCIMSY
jgi:hypothetical protein